VADDVEKGDDPLGQPRTADTTATVAITRITAATIQYLGFILDGGGTGVDMQVTPSAGLPGNRCADSGRYIGSLTTVTVGFLCRRKLDEYSPAQVSKGNTGSRMAVHMVMASPKAGRVHAATTRAAVAP